MSLDEKTVQHVAKLAALALDENDVEKAKKELSDILDYVNQLSEVNTHGVRPTSHVHGVTNAFRDDIIKDSLAVEDVAKNAPDFGHSGFLVPKIVQ